MHKPLTPKNGINQKSEQGKNRTCALYQNYSALPKQEVRAKGTPFCFALSERIRSEQKWMTVRWTVRAASRLFRRKGILFPLPRRNKRKIARSDFFIKNRSSPKPLFLLFCKKARSVFLFVCKRTHNGKLLLPLFCNFCFIGKDSKRAVVNDSPVDC